MVTSSNAGVTRMVTICTRLRQLDQVRAIADAHPSVFFAAGTHPMHAAEEPLVSVEDLLAVAEHPKMVGIGETGLDYHYTSESRDIQIESLLIHIEAARRSGLPLIIHARAADEEMARILTDEHAKGAYSCVMHCFSSSAELAQSALDLGFYLSMSGIATFKNGQSLRDIFAAAPVERILVETDSPYLAPESRLMAVLRYTILGCGSSGGVPRLGGHWGACDPKNPKNFRRRCSMLVERIDGDAITRVLIDTSPDLRRV